MVSLETDVNMYEAAVSKFFSDRRAGFPERPRCSLWRELANAASSAFIAFFDDPKPLAVAGATLEYGCPARLL